MPIKENDAHPLLLDTHIWIWLIEGDSRLEKSKALSKIEEAAGRDSLWVSIISIWELGMLVAKERIAFEMETNDWVKRALGAPGLSLASLNPHIALASSNLPGSFEGDPVDRMLIATARHCNATLVTRDKSILRYAKAGFVGAMKA